VAESGDSRLSSGAHVAGSFGRARIKRRALRITSPAVTITSTIVKFTFLAVISTSRDVQNHVKNVGSDVGNVKATYSQVKIEGEYSETTSQSFTATFGWVNLTFARSMTTSWDIAAPKVRSRRAADLIGGGSPAKFNRVPASAACSGFRRRCPPHVLVARA